MIIEYFWIAWGLSFAWFGIDFEFFHETDFSDLEDDGANDDQQVDMDHTLVQQAFDMSQGPSKKFFELCADMHPEVEYYQRKMDE